MFCPYPSRPEARAIREEEVEPSELVRTSGIMETLAREGGI
jgi:hypothetical protein